jgi:hypothetical protein
MLEQTKMPGATFLPRVLSPPHDSSSHKNRCVHSLRGNPATPIAGHLCAHQRLPKRLHNNRRTFSNSFFFAYLLQQTTNSFAPTAVLQFVVAFIWRLLMAEVESPVTQKGSKVGSGQPMSPGAKSSPSRGSGPQADSVPSQPARTSRHSEEPGTTTIVGPED